jgi:ferric-dicitrate binding protein FerR (iron transport regulator)
MNKERLMYLFRKYTDQTCNKEEHAEFMALVNSGNAVKELDELMDSEWEKHFKEEVLDKNSARQIFNRVVATDRDKETAPSLKVIKIKPMLRRAIWVAALLLIGFFVFLYLTPGGNEQVKEDYFTANGDTSVITERATAEHRGITLPDGSRVVLNKQSTLVFSSHFNKKTREVSLIGEGYFDIKHDASRPFAVHTGKIKTTVLGTAFNIKYFVRENNVIVTVTRGKVMVQKENKTLGVILPDQQIVFNQKQNTSEVLVVEARKIVEWQGNDLFFDDVTMDDAMTQLARRFNIKIRFANDDSKDCRFTATFLKGESLDEILQVITSFNHTEYQKKAGEIIISGNGCK